MNNNNNSNKILEELSKKIGISQSDMKSAAQNGTFQELLSQTDNKNAAALNSLLNDPQKAQQILNTPQAQALLKMLNGE